MPFGMAIFHSSGRLQRWGVPLNPSPATHSAAAAAQPAFMVALAVIYREFLSRLDISQRVELHMLPEDADVGVGFAGMIDIAKASPGKPGIDGHAPNLHDGHNALTGSAPARFCEFDDLPLKLPNLGARRNERAGKEPLTGDAAAPNPQRAINRRRIGVLLHAGPV